MTNTPQKHVTEPQEVTHRTDLMGFFPGNTALTFSNACFIEGGYKEQQEQPLEVSFRRSGKMKKNSTSDTCGLLWSPIILLTAE